MIGNSAFYQEIYFFPGSILPAFNFSRISGVHLPLPHLFGKLNMSTDYPDSSNFQAIELVISLTKHGWA